MKKIAGIVWYNNEVIYRRALAIFEDAFDMPSTYEDWKVEITKTAKKFKRDGWVLIRAELEPETFVTWCKARGLKIDAKARVTFGDETAQEYLRSGRGTIIDF